MIQSAFIAFSGEKKDNFNKGIIRDNIFDIKFFTSRETINI